MPLILKIFIGIVGIILYMLVGVGIATISAWLDAHKEGSAWNEEFYVTCILIWPVLIIGLPFIFLVWLAEELSEIPRMVHSDTLWKVIEKTKEE